MPKFLYDRVDLSAQKQTAAAERQNRDELTKRFYETNAAAYAEATLRLSMSDSIEPFVAQLAAGDRLIDLGCGAGRDLKVFADRGFAPVGFDASFGLAKIAREYSAQPVVVGDLRQLPFAPNSFSAGWAAASLLHLSRDDVCVALGEIRRLLKPGGLLFSSVKLGHGERVDAQGRWFSYYNPAEWQRVLESCGFPPVELYRSVQEVGTVIANEPSQWISSISRNRR